MHLMGGPVTAETLAEMHAPVAAPAVARTGELEIRVNKLEAELHELREQFAAFRRQFEG